MQSKPTEAEAMRQGRKVFTPTPQPRPQPTINPAVIITIVDGLILGCFMATHHEFAVYVGYVLTLSPIACIVAVIVRNFHWIKKQF